MRRGAVAWLATMTLVVGTLDATAQTVKTDHDPTASFASYKTYYWAKADPVPGNDIVNQRVTSAIDQQLAAKGWTKVPETQADVAVAAHGSTEQQKSLDTFYSGGMGGWGYRGWGGMGTATTTVNTYTNGTLLVDMFDAKTKKLVWRGTATATVSSDPKKNAQKIQKAAEKLFKGFPPGAPSK